MSNRQEGDTWGRGIKGGRIQYADKVRDGKCAEKDNRMEKNKTSSITNEIPVTTLYLEPSTSG